MREPNVLPAGEDDREWAAQLMARTALRKTTSGVVLRKT